MFGDIPRFARRYSFELFLASAALAATIVAGSVALSWPSDWEPAAQATLAASLISLVAGAGGLFLQAAFQKLHLETEHSLKIRAKIVESSYTYACEYLMPLAASAGELATHITEYVNTSEDEQKERYLDAALHALAQYVRVQAALTSTIPLPETPRPLGLFLSSAASEDLVWDVMLPPWVLNVRSLNDQSRLVSALYCSSPDTKEHITHLRRPESFLPLVSSDGELSDIRASFRQVLDESPHIHVNEICTTLNALCELVNYEVRVVLKAWYNEDGAAELKALKLVCEFSDETKERLGLFFDPTEDHVP